MTELKFENCFCSGNPDYLSFGGTCDSGAHADLNFLLDKSGSIRLVDYYLTPEALVVHHRFQNAPQTLKIWKDSDSLKYFNSKIAVGEIVLLSDKGDDHRIELTFRRQGPLETTIYPVSPTDPGREKYAEFRKSFPSPYLSS